MEYKMKENNITNNIYIINSNDNNNNDIICDILSIIQKDDFKINDLFCIIHNKNKDHNIYMSDKITKDIKIYNGHEFVLMDKSKSEKREIQYDNIENNYVIILN